MLRYDRQTKPGLVALYDIRPGNGAGPFLQLRSPFIRSFIHSLAHSFSFLLTYYMTSLWGRIMKWGCSFVRLIRAHFSKSITRSRRNFDFGARSMHLAMLPFCDLSFGSRALRVSASKFWNSLPLDIPVPVMI